MKRLMITAFISLGAMVAMPMSASSAATASISPYVTASPTCWYELASSGSPGGIPEYDVPDNGVPYCLQNIHACVVLGNDDGLHGALPSQGVMCADLWALDVNGDIYVLAVAEAYCQGPNTSDYPQCANIVSTADLGVTGHNTIFGQAGYCGHANGNCINGGRDYFDGEGELDGEYSSCVQAWTDLNGTNSGEYNNIELPGSDYTVYLIGNYASQHATVCPG